MTEPGVFAIDKRLLIAGGPVPRDLSDYMNHIEYSQIYKQIQASNLSAQSWACCLEYGCFCIGLFCVNCIHEPIANSVFERDMRNRIEEFNAQLFHGKPVLSMRGSGRLLQFVFNTNLLESRAELADPAVAAQANVQYVTNPALIAAAASPALPDMYGGAGMGYPVGNTGGTVGYGGGATVAGGGVYVGGGGPAVFMGGGGGVVIGGGF